KVFAPDTPLVAEAGLVRGNDTAAVRNEVRELPALGVGESDDIREDERFELPDVGRVKQPIMHHLERNTGFDERLIPAESVVFDLVADEPCGLLRINQAHAREWRFVAQIFLPAR